MPTATIEVKSLDERIRAHLPAYATPGSAGMDLRACIDAPATIGPGDMLLVPAGIAIHIGQHARLRWLREQRRRVTIALGPERMAEAMPSN